MKKVQYEIEVVPESVEVRGNALAVGDRIANARAQDEILARLANGDIWAWCTVRVSASTADHTGYSSWLGCVSSRSEASFRRGPEYIALKAEALAELAAQLRASR